MESKDIIILSVWIALSVICAVFIWVGGATLGNYIFAGLFFFLTLIFSGLVGYVLKPEKKKPEIELVNELKNIRSKLDELTREVEVIKKAIEE
jgi:hypothetical protein